MTSYKAEKTKEIIYNEVNVINYEDLKLLKLEGQDIIFISLPNKGVDFIGYYLAIIKKIIYKLKNECKLIIYADNKTLAFICYSLQSSGVIHYKTWISIKQELVENEGNIPNETKGAIIFSKSSSTIDMCKIRTPYTYCPNCNKTTKDYGGKKHLFDSYGTTMSDVWRNITVIPNEVFPVEVVSRFKDMFSTSNNERMLGISLWDYCWEKSEKEEITFPERIDLIENNTNDLQRNILINGDVLESIRMIPSNSVDYIFVDPPYNLKKKYSGYNDDLTIEEYYKWCDKWLNECYRVLKPGKFISILNIPSLTVRHFGFLIQFMELNDWITWDALSRPSGNIMPANYVISTFKKPSISGNKILNLDLDDELLPLADNYCLRQSCVNKRIAIHKKISDLWTDVHRVKHNSRRYNHPCQLPPKLLKRLIGVYTNEGDLVLDCFNGVGTTTLCAEEMKRNYIGIELAEEYHITAMNRHNDIKSGLDPFRKNDISSSNKVKNNDEIRIVTPKANNEKYTKKQVQLLIKELSVNLGKIPTKEEALREIDVSEEFYNKYFKSWSEVTAGAKATGMKEKKHKN